MDFAFTPEQEELRAQARAFLATNPEPSWQELAELGWTGVSVAEENGGAGLGFLEEAILFEEMGRALTHAPYWSTVAVTLPALPAGPAGARSRAATRAGRWPPARSSPTSTRQRGSRTIGGDSIWELEGAEREVLRTNDETRPLGVVSGGTAGRRLAGSELLPQLRARSLTALSLEACGVGARALELAVDYAKERQPVRQADRHLPGDLAPAGDDADGARARTLARPLRRLVHRRGRRARADRRGGGASRSAPTPPSPPASGRSRCTAASASPGSTCCTGSTSARSGSSPGRRHGRSFAPR